jgi:hypothetical protein
MEHSKDLVTVFTGAGVEANIIVEILKDNSIPVLAHDKFNSALQAGFIDGVAGDVEVLVEREDEAKARKFVGDYEKSLG